MLAVGNDVFLQLPSDTNRRVLHPGRIEAVSDNAYAVNLLESGLALEPGASILLYFEHDRKFVKQPVRVEGLLNAATEQDDDEADADAPVIVAIVAIGPLASAEEREFYRVSTLFTDLTVAAGSEDACKLLDVSATGFSIISIEKLQVGQVIEAAPTFEGQAFPGQASVQSIQDLGAGEFRYGLLCVTERGADSVLLNGLQQISMAIQRQQLRRISGQAG